ncbi:hypothetical protein TCAL_14610 [Tigriopus californicus]|uniref:Uncharacterized protein n=1 Tax=Tigriopus californicus TaxID=6832 RepID=A0A553PB71_TIGCA|nr:hypothetical protein TCAL_14610 [Tigriopus californicus]
MGVGDPQNINAMIEHAFLPKETYFGWRSPFLFTAGDESFMALNKSNILYDSSLSFYEKSWPYPMLKTEKTRSCLIKPCPPVRTTFFGGSLSVWTGIDARSKEGGNSVYLNTCAKRCPSQRLEITFNYFGGSCCEAV